MGFQMAGKIIRNFKKSLLGQYTGSLLELMPRKVAITLLLMVLISLNEAVSLLILIPLLQLVGLDLGQGSLDQITGIISSLFLYFGVTPTLPLVLIIYVLVVSLSALLLRWQTIKSHQIQYLYSSHLRKELYGSITHSNWLFFARSKSSDFAHALTNEIERISTGTYQFLLLIASIMILIVYVIFALELAGVLTGFIFLVGVVILLLLRRKVRRSGTRGEEITTTTRDLYSSIIQHLDGMKTIKSFGLEEKNTEIFSKQSDHVAERYIDTIKSYADVKVLFDIGTVVVLSVMVIVLVEVIKLPMATLLLLIYIFVRMIPRFSTIQNSYQYFINMLPAYRNVMDLMRSSLEHGEKIKHKGMESKYGRGLISFKEEINLEDVSFSYPTGHFKIDGLNLKIPAGKTTAIAGQSGAGKSTVADLVMGLVEPDDGRMTVDGDHITRDRLCPWRSDIGYVAQETFLFNESVRFNLQLAQPGAGEKDLEDALKMAAAYDFVSKLPDGLNTIIGDRGVRLSGGERQRLALARALLRKPALLIMDEATSNLDSENEKRIIKAIDDLHGDITILVIAHRLSTIKNADQIYLMDDGRVVESGSWSELLENDEGYFWRFWEGQSTK